MYRILTLLSILFIACSPQTSNPEVESWESQAENITIIRDDFGVPHIYGKTDADAVFG
ncbi:MAG: penicillin acylase family protein, partial [Ekhidna sp.]